MKLIEARVYQDDRAILEFETDVLEVKKGDQILRIAVFPNCPTLLWDFIDVVPYDTNCKSCRVTSAWWRKSAVSSLSWFGSNDAVVFAILRTIKYLKIFFRLQKEMLYQYSQAELVPVEHLPAHPQPCGKLAANKILNDAEPMCTSTVSSPKPVRYTRDNNLEVGALKQFLESDRCMLTCQKTLSDVEAEIPLFASLSKQLIAGHLSVLKAILTSNASLPGDTEASNLSRINSLCRTLRESTRMIEMCERCLAEYTAADNPYQLPVYSATEWPDLNLWHHTEVESEGHEICTIIDSEAAQALKFKVRTLWSGVSLKERLSCSLDSLECKTCRIDGIFEFTQKTDIKWRECPVTFLANCWGRDQPVSDKTVDKVMYRSPPKSWSRDVAHEFFTKVVRPIEIVRYHTDSMEGVQIALLILASAEQTNKPDTPAETETQNFVFLTGSEMQVRIDNQLLGTFQANPKNDVLLIDCKLIEPNIEVTRHGFDRIPYPKDSLITFTANKNVARRTKIHVLNYSCHFTATLRDPNEPDKEYTPYDFKIRDEVISMLAEKDLSPFSFGFEIDERECVTIKDKENAARN